MRGLTPPPLRRWRRDRGSIDAGICIHQLHVRARRLSAFRRTRTMSSSILRRITALVTALLLLQLTLTSGSAACAVHVRGADAMADEHHGRSMPNEVGAASSSSYSPVASNAGPRHMGGDIEWRGGAPAPESSCRGHGSTGPCDSMASCTPVVLGADDAGASVVATHSARAIPIRVLTPPTPTTAPELPPPRS